MGRTTSSRSSTGRVPSSTRPPARTRTSSSTRSASGAPPRRASAATTRAGRTASSRRAWRRSRAIVAAAEAAFPWIAFEGRWGELQKAFFNGPTGPNLKTQWTQPITWSEGWRDRSYAVPAGGAFGTGATDFFCSGGRDAARGRSSQLLRNPLPTRHLPRDDPRARDLRRSTGDLDAGRAAADRPAPLVGPDHLGLGAHVRQAAATLPRPRRAPDPDRVRDHRSCSGSCSQVARPRRQPSRVRRRELGVPRRRHRHDARAARARPRPGRDGVRARRDRRGPTGRRVTRLPARLRRIRPLLGAIALFVAVWVVLTTTVFLIPVAIWLAVRWCLVAPVVELEDRRPLGVAPPQRRARPRPLDPRRLARRGQRRGRAARGAAARRDPDLRDRHAARAPQHRRRRRLRARDAVRRPRHRLRLLRRACPPRARARRARRPSSRRRSSSTR